MKIQYIKDTGVDWRIILKWLLNRMELNVLDLCIAQDR